MIKPKKNIAKLFRTMPDVESRRNFLRLDKNDRLIPFPEKIWDRFRELLDDIAVMTYPEQENFYIKLASYIDVPRNNILLSLGSDLAIKMVYETFINSGDKVQMHLPSYAMYSVYNNMFGANASFISYDENLELDIETFIDNISNKTKMVVVENPNGFIGEKLGFENIRNIAKKAHMSDAILLIDEAYYQFMGESAQQLYLEYDNVIIVRSFSKDFGMAGLRCGYLLSNEKNIELLFRVKPMNETNSAAIAFGLAVLDYPDLVDKYIREIKKSTTFLKEKLTKLDFKFSGGNGNFLVIFVGDAINEVITLLKKRKVLVRRPFQVDSLHGWLRVAIGSIADVENFIDCFKEVNETIGKNKK